MRINLLLCTTALVLGGCAGLEDYQYRFVHGFRADAAWRMQHGTRQRRELSSHYAKGWKAGYFEVSTGGCGETPAVPPPDYWTAKYQSEPGQAAIEDWFTGFQDGATAAQSSGLDAWHPVPTSPAIPTGIDGLYPGAMDYSLSNTHEQGDVLQPLSSPSESNEPVQGRPTPGRNSPLKNPNAAKVPALLEPSLLLPSPAVQANAIPPVVTE